MNTYVNAVFSKAIDPDSVRPETFGVQCDGIAIPGNVAAEGAKLFFRPSTALPIDTLCEATVAGPFATDGTPLQAHWTFATGNQDAYVWKFSEPRATFTTNSGAIIRQVGYGDGHLLVAFTVGATLYLGVSDDGGASFTVAETQPVVTNGYATAEEADLTYRDGRVHLAWRVLPFNYAQSEVFYAHSTTSLTTLTRPEMLSTPWDGMEAMSPHVAAGPDGAVHVAWDEDCGDACDPDILGVHLVTLSAGGDIFVEHERLSNYRSWDPRMTWIGSTLLMSWIHVNSPWMNVLRDQSAGQSIGQLADSDLQIWPQSRALLTSGQTTVLHWMEGYGLGDHTYYTARYDARSGTLSDARQLLFVSADDYRFECSRMTAAENGDLLWYSAVGRNPPPGVWPYPESIERTLSRSVDAGTSFRGSTKLDFMLPYDPVGNDSDPVCVFIAGASSDRPYMVWHRDDGSPYQTRFMVSRGELVPECSN